MATRNGSAEWRGDLESGAGSLTVGEGVFSGDYSFASRFEEGEGTNPEELIAAAHAACFSMALSADLAGHGHPVDELLEGDVGGPRGRSGPTPSGEHGYRDQGPSGHTSSPRPVVAIRLAICPPLKQDEPLADRRFD